jgi:hypothetical protein
MNRSITLQRQRGFVIYTHTSAALRSSLRIWQVCLSDRVTRRQQSAAVYARGNPPPGQQALRREFTASLNRLYTQ